MAICKSSDHSNSKTELINDLCVDVDFVLFVLFSTNVLDVDCYIYVLFSESIRKHFSLYFMESISEIWKLITKFEY